MDQSGDLIDLTPDRATVPIITSGKRKLISGYGGSFNVQPFKPQGEVDAHSPPVFRAKAKLNSKDKKLGEAETPYLSTGGSGKHRKTFNQDGSKSPIMLT